MSLFNINKSLTTISKQIIKLAPVTSLSINNQQKCEISYHHKMYDNRRYAGRHMITLISGDGVGPEMIQHVKQVFRFIDAPVDFEDVTLTKSSSDAEFINALKAVKRNRIVLKSNADTDINEPGFKIRNLELRTKLDLFANVVHCKSYDGIQTRHDNIDLVVIRENTEGEYRQLEHSLLDQNGEMVVESLKIITRDNSIRIADYAFKFAVRNNRKKITAVHKANIMKMADGLFLECAREVSKDYPEIEFQDMIVDNCSMQLVSKPQQFDVMLMPNLYGSIITNISAGLVGGAGLISGVNIGNNFAVFETGARATGHEIAGKNIANPTAMLLAGVDLLKYLRLTDEAIRIQTAINKVLQNNEYHTSDIHGNCSTEMFMEELFSKLRLQQ